MGLSSQVRKRGLNKCVSIFSAKETCGNDFQKVFRPRQDLKEKRYVKYLYSSKTNELLF